LEAAIPMDDIIQKIIDLESKAREIVGEAIDERKAYEDNIRMEIDAYREEILKENKEKIDDYARLMQKEADEAVKHLEDAAKLKISQMQKTAANNKNEWIEHLLNKIINGEI
jgi:vacuolar-type H+-ATPase subunit H